MQKLLTCTSTYAYLWTTLLHHSIELESSVRKFLLQLACDQRKMLENYGVLHGGVVRGWTDNDSSRLKTALCGSPPLTGKEDLFLYIYGWHIRDSILTHNYKWGACARTCLIVFPSSS